MPLKLLIVCTANVCRSPMAAALLHRHCLLRGVEAAVGSAGTVHTDLLVDPVAVEVLTEYGHDIAQHRPRRLTRTILDAEGADLVLVMTRDHLRVAATTSTGAFRRTFTLREFARRAAESEPEEGRGLGGWLTSVAEQRRARDLMGDDDSDDIADPYGASLEVHRLCAGELNQLMEVVARTLAMLADLSRSTS